MTLYTGIRLTTREALKIAQAAHPLDLAARCAFLQAEADSCPTVSDQAAWLEALAKTCGKR